MYFLSQSVTDSLEEYSSSSPFQRRYYSVLHKGKKTKSVGNDQRKGKKRIYCILGYNSWGFLSLCRKRLSTPEFFNQKFRQFTEPFCSVSKMLHECECFLQYFLLSSLYLCFFPPCRFEWHIIHFYTAAAHLHHRNTSAFDVVMKVRRFVLLY